MPFRFYISIPCFPAGQPRVKATVRGKHAGVYTPTTVGTGANKRPHPAVEFRHAIQQAVWSALPDHVLLLDCPLRLTVMAWFPRSTADTKKTKPNPPLWKTGTPDADNVAKSVMDCLTGIVWRDDSFICDLVSRKAVVIPGQSPGVEILIEELTELPAHMEAAK
jgi:Holliday junction resolvase RusA-like endonuclease